MNRYRVVQTIHAHAGGTTSVSFSPDGMTLASGGYDCAVRLWGTATGKAQRALPGHRRGHVAFSPDGALLVSGGLHANAIVYDAGTWRALQTLEETSATWEIAFRPDGRLLVVVQPQVPLQMWDTRTWQSAHEVDVGHEYVYALAYAPPGDRLAFAIAEEGIVHVRASDFMEEIATLSPHQPSTYGLAFSPDGARLATAGADAMVCLWETATWQAVEELRHDSPVLCVAFAPEGTRLVTGSLAGRITVWDAE